MNEKKPTSTPPPAALDALLQREPDLVDKIFEYVLKQLPELSPEALKDAKAALRAHVGGSEAYIKKRDPEVAYRVLRLFNGRNATQVSRELGISRGSVYRIIKQAGR